MSLKVWEIDYVKGGKITKLCDLNEIQPRLYHSAKKVKCNFCKKDATIITKMGVDISLRDAFPDVDFIADIPICEEHYKQFMEKK